MSYTMPCTRYFPYIFVLSSTLSLFTFPIQLSLTLLRYFNRGVSHLLLTSTLGLFIFTKVHVIPVYFFFFSIFLFSISPVSSSYSALFLHRQRKRQLSVSFDIARSFFTFQIHSLKKIFYFFFFLS